MITFVAERKIDELGRIALPAELRQRFRLSEGGPVKIYANDSSVFLVPAPESRCFFCRYEAELIDFNGKLVCKSCFEKIKILHEMK